MSEIKRAKLDANGEVVTRPVARSVQGDLDDFMRQHRDALDAVLAKHGLTTFDIVAPQYEEVVSDDR